MAKLSTNTKTDILVHFGILIAAFLIVFFAFFFFFLPWVTNHGESITVPDLRGMSLSEMEDTLDSKGLNYEITDSTFVAGMAPLSVFSHYPKAEAFVKSGRKVYLTIITDKAPMVSLPDVLGRSTNSAKNLLVSVGFAAPKVEYIPAMEENTVLKLKYNAKEITPGKKLAKGTIITLIVGDGYGNTSVEIPDVTGMPLDEADIIISGKGLSVGSILYEPNSSQPIGSVTRQRPTPANGQLRTGSSINLWISGDENTEGIPDIDN